MKQLSPDRNAMRAEMVYFSNNRRRWGAFLFGTSRVVHNRIRTIDRRGAHFVPRHPTVTRHRAVNEEVDPLGPRHLSRDIDLDHNSIVPSLAKYERRESDDQYWDGRTKRGIAFTGILLLLIMVLGVTDGIS
jgi:hypothetical protein